MNAVIISQDQFNDLAKRMEEIHSAVTKKQATPEEAFIDNEEFLKLMKVSRRTGQSWRDEGIISFSQIGSKIYYRMSDVQKLLDGNHKKAFKK